MFMFLALGYWTLPGLCICTLQRGLTAFCSIFFRMLGLWFSSELDWVFYYLNFCNCFQLGALVHPMKLLFSEISFYLYKSTIHPVMDHCCHTLNRDSSEPPSFLELPPGNGKFAKPPSPQFSVTPI